MSHHVGVLLKPNNMPLEFALALRAQSRQEYRKLFFFSAPSSPFVWAQVSLCHILADHPLPGTFQYVPPLAQNQTGSVLILLCVGLGIIHKNASRLKQHKLGSAKSSRT